MHMISAFVLKECSLNARFRPSQRTPHQAQGMFKAMETIKSKLGHGTPGPLAEALEVIDFLPPEDRLEGAWGILQSMRHLCCQQQEDGDRGREGAVAPPFASGSGSGL